MVGLDRHGRAAGEADTFDDVRVERSLSQELGAFDLVGVLLEHVDEEPADDLALRFRIRLAFQLAEEQLTLVRMDERNVVVVPEHADHFIGLVQAKKAVVDEDAGQLVADRLVDQDGRHRAVHAAGQTADDLLVADLLTDPGDRILTIGVHGPVAGEARDTDKILIKLPAVRRMVHFRMELNRIEVARRIGRDGEGRVR